MDRRSFLKSAGMSAAGTAFAADVFGASPEKSGNAPQFSSGSNRDRSQIQSNDLTPWSPSTAQPWDVHTINHLYRRAGFGATLAEIAAAKGKNYSDVIDGLLNDAFLTQATNPPIPGHSDDNTDRPSWLRVPPSYYFASIGLDKQLQDYVLANAKIASHWAMQMNQPSTMLREKLTLFWMNHFVVEIKKIVYPQQMYSFLTYLRQNAWGNFKKMVSDVSSHPAMLSYLDGIENIGTNPNENYARELQELFTMGATDKDGNANYTQEDVAAMAVVFSGWTVDTFSSPPDPILPAVYVPSNHNSSKEMIYDKTPRIYNLTAANAPLMEMDIIDHIFDQRGDKIAWYICSKLYQFFVYHDISGDSEKSVIGAMATLFQQSNWEIKPVISALLKSAHFFDEANIGAGIKSPCEHLIGLVRTFDIQIDELAGGTITQYVGGGSQQLLDPPNVKGWPGYHSWLSTTTLPYRQVMQAALVGSLGTLPSFGGTDGYGSTNFLKPILLPDAALLSWAQQFTNYTSGTFDDFVAEIATYLCAHTPSNTALNKFVKNGYPAGYEWASLSDALKIPTLRIVLNRIMQLGDFQLC